MGVAPGRLISRLSAGTTNYCDVGRGGGCEFSCADIAQALEQVEDRAAYLLLLRKWAGHSDESSEQEVVRLLVLRVVENWAAPERWDVRRRDGETRAQRAQLGGPIERMVKAAMTEAVDPMICTTCNGRGVVYKKCEIGSAVVEVSCGAARCVGGRVRVSDRQRAVMCGMNWEMYRGRWRGRYDRVVQLVNQLIIDGGRDFMVALGE